MAASCGSGRVRVCHFPCSLPFFFIGYVARVTHEDAQGWGGVERAHAHPSVATWLPPIERERERDTHTHTRGELAYTPILAPLHYMVERDELVHTDHALPLREHEIVAHDLVCSRLSVP